MSLWRREPCSPRMRRAHRLHIHIYASFLLILVLSVGAALFAARALREEHNDVPRHITRVLQWIVAESPSTEALVARGDELGLHLAVFDSTGRTLRATSTDITAPGADANTGWTRTSLGWGLVLRTPDGGAIVSVPRHDPFDGRLRRYGIALLVMLLVVGIGSYKLARRITRRLDGLTETLDRFGEGDLTARASVTGRYDEVRLVAERFNAAADRVQALVAAERRMTANASHELRSPLARIRLALELAREAPSRELIDGAVADIAELDRLVEDLLVDARLAARGAERSAVPVDLSALVAELVGPVSAPPEDGASAQSDAVRLAVDERAVRRAIRNLLDNAVEHAGGVTRVRVLAIEGGAAVEVEDEGSLAAQDVPALFEPFARRQGSRGAGLGLSLARDVAEAHGGTLVWRARQPKGSIFRLELR